LAVTGMRPITITKPRNIHLPILLMLLDPLRRRLLPIEPAMPWLLRVWRRSDATFNSNSLCAATSDFEESSLETRLWTKCGSPLFSERTISRGLENWHKFRDKGRGRALLEVTRSD
jgi:hypothetical protein